MDAEALRAQAEALRKKAAGLRMWAMMADIRTEHDREALRRADKLFREARRLEEEAARRE